LEAGVQLEAPAAAYDPPSQSVHWAAAAAEKEPALQAVQTEAEARENLPAGQGDDVPVVSPVPVEKYPYTIY